mmetsp:Transcript_8398/g.21686  ORF Transcript_8398/g.21686 Transcript_8398/m.21686 type:complete len:286 (+) Transcript_8398:71-928(+)
MEESKQPPNILADLKAVGVEPLHAAVAVAVVGVTLFLYALLAKPKGRAVLTYFEGHGRAEEIKLMLCVCGVPWVDRVYGDEHGAQFITTEAQMRKIMAAGVLAMEQLPLLELDGLNLVQQAAILRYLARRHGLYGRSSAEAAQIDILSDSIADWGPVAAIIKSVDPGHAKYLNRFARALKSNEEGEFLVGRELSFVDIQLFQALTQLAATKEINLKVRWPELDAYRARIAELPPIAQYLASDRRLPFPGRGGKTKFITDVSKVIPWVFGQSEQPSLLCDVWHFRK